MLRLAQNKRVKISADIELVDRLVGAVPKSQLLEKLEAYM